MSFLCFIYIYIPFATRSFTRQPTRATSEPAFIHPSCSTVDVSFIKGRQIAQVMGDGEIFEVDHCNKIAHLQGSIRPKAHIHDVVKRSSFSKYSGMQAVGR